MAREKAEAIDRRVKWGLLVISLITLAMLVRAALVENVFSDWHGYRKGYAKILQDKATDDRTREIASGYAVEIRQNVVPVLGRVDRCITCHTGLDDPRMKDQPQPYTTHPGRYLEVHEPGKFGCTVCHQGQGRALVKEDAHGRVAHWESPLLPTRFTKTSCTRCHQDTAVFGESPLLTRLDDEACSKEGTELLLTGRRLSQDNGCLGCHLLEGKGGSLGPDLTGIGDKAAHGFDFSHLPVHHDEHGGQKDVVRWLREHFLDPEAVSPETVMPDIGLDDFGADALTAYMLSRRQPVALAPQRDHGEPALRPGRELYASYCSSCHGEKGEGSRAPAITTPVLNNPDALAVADDDFYRLIISSGRSGTDMPAWRDNLSPSEIDAIVDYIRGWEPGGARIDAVSADHGDAAMGRAYYLGRCANCHGRQGDGGVGSSLASPTFLAVASDRFLAESIVRGRPGTAMPSWRDLSDQAVSDLLAFVRTWHPARSSVTDVQSRLSRKSAEISRIGAQIYRAQCASCHGRQGEGGIGPSLATPDLLRAVDDEYLIHAILDGRPGTAMPAWRHLSSADIAALVSHLRGWQDGRRYRLAALPTSGDYHLGEQFYNMACQGCHGEQAVGGVGPQLANPAFLASVSDELLMHWIAYGRTGTAMKGFLPEEQGPVNLSLDQIADVIAYLRHVGTAAPPGVKRTGVGDAAVGAILYQGSCASCHGVHGEGASGPQLNNPVFLETASDGFLAATLVLGRTGTPMRSMVHGLEGLAEIDPDNVQDLIAFMRLWEYPRTWREPRLVAEISKRAVDSGRHQYEAFCSPCHGPTGRGVLDGPDYYAPALNNPEFLRAATDGFLLATIARGRGGTQMPTFGPGAEGMAALRAEDMMDIVSFLRTWQWSGKTPEEGRLP